MSATRERILCDTVDTWTREAYGLSMTNNESTPRDTREVPLVYCVGCGHDVPASDAMRYIDGYVCDEGCERVAREDDRVTR